MSAIDALTSAQSSGGAGGLSNLSSGDFFKLILTELTKQDPLAPNDTNALLQQISAVRSIQSDMDLSNDLGRLVQQNEFASAAMLVGKTVSGVDENFERVTGEVKSVARTQDGTMLILKSGERIPVGYLDEIKQTASSGGGE
ncbi:MAG TPA: flagellar hook capping FlgD N-terminal domain-containing protein [Phycisphaerales bacterium]|nr:flagellar hook capping FlgD N-terminal domain-containing protein [Phycisphaerales bacterium]